MYLCSPILTPSLSFPQKQNVTNISTTHTRTHTGTSKSFDPHTKSWLYGNDLQKSVNDIKNGNNLFIVYKPLVIRMVKILEILNENSNRIVVGGERDGYGNLIDISKLSWVLREFELIDLLISQVNIVLY
jgi:hypothetical protein